MRGTERRLPQRPLRTYPSLARFYGADSRRIASRERDIGLWWREAVGSPLHRAAWVSDTGELYLVRLGPAEQGGGVVEVLAECTDREQLESVLEGWREQCGEPRSLSWLRARARRLRQHEPRPRVRLASGAAAG
jgi:hypothetical protein